MLYIISPTQHRGEIILQPLPAYRLTREFSINLTVICSFHLTVYGFITFAHCSQFSIILELLQFAARTLVQSSSLCFIQLIFSERELMFMFAICRPPSVCLSVVCLSVVCL